MSRVRATALTRCVEGLESGVEVVRLEGELDADRSAELGEQLFRLAHRGRWKVVLDFLRVSHVDYRGLKPLVTRAELFRQAGGDIRIAGLSAYLGAIFRVAGAWQRFEIFPTTVEAEASFVSRHKGAVC